MLFTSLPFICFLAAVLLLYYLIPKKAQWPLLLAASYAFYAIADWRYLLFIITTTVTVFLSALFIDRFNKQQSDYLAAHKKELSKEQKTAYKNKMKAKKWALLLIGLLFNLAILSFTKYTRSP